MRGDLGLGEGPGCVLDQLVLVGEREVDHGGIVRGCDRLRGDVPADTLHGMDTAANLTPVLGRYFQREWSHGIGHRLYDTDGNAYLDFANGIAVTALGHTHPRVTAAIHAQVDRLIGPISAIGFTDPISRLATEITATFPEPLDSVLFLNSGSEAIDGAAQARAAGHRPARDHRLPRRLPRAAPGARRPSRVRR